MSTRNVGDACEWSQVSRRATVKDSVTQHGDLVLYALRKMYKGRVQRMDNIGYLWTCTLSSKKKKTQEETSPRGEKRM